MVLDFDGTVTDEDIGDLVCARFAPPAWRDIDEAWVRGELPLDEAQRRMWGLCRAGRDEAVAFAEEVARLRPGLDALLAAARGAGAEVWLASGGFDFYIEPLLGEHRLSSLAARYYNRARFVDGGIAVEFPHEGLRCARCAVCKGAVCTRAQRLGPVAFVGDGYSDRCVLEHGAPDRVFAVRGSALHRLLEEGGREAEVIDDLAEVGRALFQGRGAAGDPGAGSS